MCFRVKITHSTHKMCHRRLSLSLIVPCRTGDIASRACSCIHMVGTCFGGAWHDSWHCCLSASSKEFSFEVPEDVDCHKNLSKAEAASKRVSRKACSFLSCDYYSHITKGLLSCTLPPPVRATSHPCKTKGERWSKFYEEENLGNSFLVEPIGQV